VRRIPDPVDDDLAEQRHQVAMATRPHLAVHHAVGIRYGDRPLGVRSQVKIRLNQGSAELPTFRCDLLFQLAVGRLQHLGRAEKGYGLHGLIHDAEKFLDHEEGTRV